MQDEVVICLGSLNPGNIEATQKCFGEYKGKLHRCIIHFCLLLN
jgi:hypothetical protein